MIKNFLFAAALLNLALACGCAVGGSGPCAGSNCPSIAVSGSSGNISPVVQAPVGGTITFTATLTNTSENTVNWSLIGSSCSGSSTSSSNPCGYFTATTATTATYQAPATVPSNNAFTVQAETPDTNLGATDDLTIVHITTAVAPGPPNVGSTNVGSGLTQEFTAVATPDNAPQTFTWTCTAGGGACANFKQDTNISGLAYYTAADSCAGNGCVQISAVSAADPAGCTAEKCTVAKATILPSRLPSGTYAFKFSGYDSSNNPVNAAGTFAATNGTINGGVEDVINSSGFTQLTITGGSYQPTSTDTDNSNNAGTLTISTSAGTTHYLAVLDSAGDIQFIQSDANGKGSGVAESATGVTAFNSGGTYAFGLSGADASSARVGYAGVLTLNGGTVTNGQMDVNDNGNNSTAICSSPCGVTGSYIYNASTNVGTLSLTAGASGNFDFFVADGSSSSKPPVANVYIIAKGNAGGAIDATHPAVVGAMALQDSTVTTYNTAAFNGPSISALTGANANVSLTNGSADGNGGFTGTFDWNNNGTMISVPPSSTCTTPTICSFTNTYAASTRNNGRYTLQMLGNPNGSPAVAALPFVLYASGANSGFLLESDSATSVITGTMSAQNANILFVPAALPGTYAVATASNRSPNIAPLTMNLLLTSPGNAVFNVTGTQNPGTAGNITGGAFDVQTTGSGTLSTTTSSGTADYVLYGVDGSHFYLMRDATKDAGVPSALYFVAE